MNQDRDSLIEGHGAPFMNYYEEIERRGSSPQRRDNDSEEYRRDWTADWFPRLYDELRALAHAQRGRYRNPDSPGTTSIVHEAFERLNRSPGSEPEHAQHRDRQRPAVAGSAPRRASRPRSAGGAGARVLPAQRRVTCAGCRAGVAVRGGRAARRNRQLAHLRRADRRGIGRFAGCLRADGQAALEACVYLALRSA